MNILYVVHDFFPRFYGGTERYVLNIAKQMQRMGHSATVLTYGIEDPPESFEVLQSGLLCKKYVYEGVPVMSVRHRTIPAEIGFVIDDEPMEQAIAEVIRGKNFDVMHIAHPMRMACCYRAARNLGILVVFTLTDFWLLCPRGRFFKPDYSLCNSPEKGLKCVRECGVSESIMKRYEDAKRMFESVDVLLSPSKFLIENYKSHGWDRQILHINHGVDYANVRPLPPKDGAARTVSFGYTGVVTRFKGVDLLLKSFREVRSPDITLKIYGNCVWDTEFNAELSRAVEEDTRIQLMGKYEHGQLPQVMSEIDVVVVPSTTLESYGLVVVESMAYGIPVIASDIVGSAYEYIRDGENGFVFSVGRPDTLKLIIEKISNNPSLIEDMKKKVFSPPRIEEEAFMVESVYRKSLS